MEHESESLVDAAWLVSTIKASGSRWLLVSTYEGGEAQDIETGVAAWRPDLSQPPFDLGQPERVIQDGYDWSDPEKVRDPAKKLGLWRLS